jgi:hypothetical protein
MRVPSLCSAGANSAAVAAPKVDAAIRQGAKAIEQGAEVVGNVADATAILTVGVNPPVASGAKTVGLAADATKFAIN